MKSDLLPLWMEVLYHLKDYPNISLMARELNLNRSNLNRVFKDLVADNCIEYNFSDGTAKMYVLTKQGRAYRKIVENIKRISSG